MGIFDSYYISKNFKCPDCGEKYNKESDFQSKDGACILAGFTLGSQMDSSRRYCDWYTYCAGQYNRSDFSKPKKKNGEYPIKKATCKTDFFNCRVFINEKGIAYKEIVTSHKKDIETSIYEASHER